MATIDQRIISGRGVLLAPTTLPGIQKAKALTLTAQVIRPPTNANVNSSFNPSRLLYARISALRSDAVIRILEFEYDSQAWDFYADISAQSLYAIKCSYEGVLQSFANLETALGLTVTKVTDNIASWGSTILFPDTFLVTCNADTALQLTLESIPFDICDADISFPTLPNPPIEKPTQVEQGVPIPAGTSNSISPPYEEPNDGGNTIPYGIDNKALTSNICFRILNTGVDSGDIVFENFVCAVKVEFPPGPLSAGRATFGIIATAADGSTPINNPQAGLLDTGMHSVSNPPNSDTRNPTYSFGNCDSCAI